MENQQATSINQPQSTELKTPLWKNKWILLFTSIIVLFLIAVLSFSLGKQTNNNNHTQSNNIIPSPTTITTSNKQANVQSGGLINLSNGPATNLFFKGAITSPANYFATDDSMLESYSSQGGMAPPRLILMKNYQVVGDNFFKTVTEDSKNDCIAIWSTMGINEINSWISLVNLNQSNSNPNNIKLSEKETISVGTRQADAYLLSGNTKVYVGFINIGDKDSTSYFFHTCNTNNKEDFLEVIKSIKFRGDLKF